MKNRLFIYDLYFYRIYLFIYHRIYINKYILLVKSEIETLSNDSHNLSVK